MSAMNLLEQVEADPWLAVRIGKVRYFYRGQHVLWQSHFCGVLPARVVQPFAPKFGMEPQQWKWVTDLGLPQPPSFCHIEITIGNGGSMTVETSELEPAPSPTFHAIMQTLRTNNA